MRYVMQNEEMVRIIGEELKHIPKGTKPQNELRMIYNVIRRRSLSNSGENIEESRKEDLLKSIDEVKKSHPDFKPEYDAGCFA